MSWGEIWKCTDLEKQCLESLSDLEDVFSSMLESMDCAPAGSAQYCSSPWTFRQSCPQVVWQACWMESPRSRPSLVGVLGTLKRPDGELTFIVVLVVYFLLSGTFIASLVAALEWCLRQIHRLGLRGALWGCCSSACTLAANTWRSLSMTSFPELSAERREQIMFQLNQRRTARFLKAAKLIARGMPLLAIGSLADYEILLKDPISLINPELVCSERSVEDSWLCGLSNQQKLISHVLGIVLLWIMCLMATRFPNLVGHRFINTTQCMVFIGIGWHVWDMVDPGEYVTFQRGTLVHVRLASALVCGHTPTVALLNAGLFCVQTWLLSTVPNFDNTVSHPSPAIREAFTNAFVITMVSYVLESTNTEHMKQFVFADNSTNQAKTAVDVLNTMCDAVVELCDMKVKSPCPRLEALTFRIAGAGLVGKSFLDYVAVVDRERCKEALASNAGDAFTLHLDLLDSSACKIPVQLFVKCLMAWNGSLEHIIGVREDGDSAHLFATDASAVNAQAIDCIANTFAHQSESEGPPSPARSASWTSARSVVEIASDAAASSKWEAVIADNCMLAVMPSGGWLEVPIAWVDSRAPWEITKFTRCFVNLFGPSFMQDKTAFASWMADRERVRFEEWIDGILGSPDKLRGVSLLDLCLAPPHCPGMQIKCNLLFLFAFAHASQAGEDGSKSDLPLSFAMEFNDVRFKLIKNGKQCHASQQGSRSGVNGPMKKLDSGQRLQL
eukprot:TRINITY_DN12386_c0_g1_i3.p1 TRINITY_DN12386_c0_g1~~TRINITY_DN12386_c0_g1_i3.p1  ORF type:complete len:728 (+),score=73.24 TRINITY_DN12386_c0_g1_i3:101-2284(+)